MQKEKILITGANGLLGRRALLDLKHHYEVFALVHELPSIAISDIRYLQINLSQEWSENDLPQDLLAIVHLAQSSKFRDFPDSALDIFKVNIESTTRLLDFAYKNKVKKFIYASSGGIYGNSDVAFNENTPVIAHGQLGYYLSSKLCGEVIAQNYQSYMDISILRFFFMYGGEQRKSMLIPRLVDSIRNDLPITLQGEEGIRINPVHVSDGSKALSAALKLTGYNTVNIAGPDILSLKEIANIIGHKFGKNPIFSYLNSQPTHLIGDIEAMQRLLHAPQISLENGLNDWL